MINIDPTLEFKAWPKIPRGQHEQITITEKIDGTNACIIIRGGEIVGIQSRKRFISPNADGEQNDNFGFARWVHDNAGQLLQLGDGEHYGEWAGEGIQKNPHNLKGRKFFLFNTFRWNEGHQPPECCAIVPVLYQGDYDHTVVKAVIGELFSTESDKGNTPEGVIVYFHNTRRYEKHTFGNTRGKWQAKAA